MGIISGIKLGFHTVKQLVRGHAPEILLTGGVILMTAGGVMLLKRSRKVNERLDTERRWELWGMESEPVENDEDDCVYIEDEFILYRDLISPEEAEDETARGHAIIKSRIRTGWYIAKDLAVPIALFGGSVLCFVAAHNIQARRIAVMASAYNTLLATYQDYRDRVAASVGEDVEQAIADGATITGYDPESKTYSVSETPELPEATGDGDVPDDLWSIPWNKSTSNYWEKDPMKCSATLEAAENLANSKLRTRYYYYLDELYRELGMTEEFILAHPEAHYIGWVVTPEQIVNDERDGETKKYLLLGIEDPCNADLVDWRCDQSNYNPDWEPKVTLHLKGLSGYILNDGSGVKPRPTR